MKTKFNPILAGLLTFISCLLMAVSAGATNYTLTLNTAGSGTVSKNPTNTSYPSGVTVTITATPNAGWYFANWTGDTNSTLNPLNVTMNSNLVITGNFLAYPTYSLTLTTNGQGGITLNPPGGSYLSNTVVTATATPAAGWVLAAWLGVTNSHANPVSFAVNANGSLLGLFAQLPAFDTQPVSVTNKPGSTVTFTSHSVGTSPLSYQWFFNGGSLTNGTSATLALTNVNPSQSGNYWVVATNNYGSATSQVASLTLTNTIGPTNVVNSADQGSLQAAIALGGWVEIGFNGTLILTNTINITNNVVLDGTGVAATISGGNAVRLFYVANGAGLTISNLTLANGSCIVTNTTGATYADGGAIYNDGGTVSLAACTLINNNARSIVLAQGGAIYNNGGFVSLLGTVVSSNNAVGSGYYQFPSTIFAGEGDGGAIYTIKGSCYIVNCMFNNNSCSGAGSSPNGGAVCQASGFLAITNSVFATNFSLASSLPEPYPDTPPGVAGYGGAVAVAGSVVIDHCQFTGNTVVGGSGSSNYGSASGGAIYSSAMLAVNRSSFFGNQGTAGTANFSTGASGFGGAIYNSGTAQLNCCVVYSNNIQGNWGTLAHFYNPTGGGDGLGGGIFNASQLTLTNCTIALNSAVNGSGTVGGTNGNALGGGVFNASSATFTAMNVTIASNFCVQGTYAFSEGSINGIAAGCQIGNTNGTLRVHNTLIAYSGTNSNAYGPITDDGYNICSDGSANLFSGSSYNYTDPQLAPLGNYGGPTLCMALLASSPAIDNGDSNGAPNTDQRGYLRPFGSGVDMGAYEYGAVQSSVPSLSLSLNGNNVLLSFTAFPPSTYRLQWSTNLTAWSDLSTNGSITVSTNISQSVSKQGFNHCYFRLLVQ